MTMNGLAAGLLGTLVLLVGGVVALTAGKTKPPDPPRKPTFLETLQQNAWRVRGAVEGAAKGLAVGHLAYIPAAGLGFGLGATAASAAGPFALAGGLVGAQAVGSAATFFVTPAAVLGNAYAGATNNRLPFEKF